MSEARQGGSIQAVEFALEILEYVARGQASVGVVQHTVLSDGTPSQNVLAFVEDEGVVHVVEHEGDHIVVAIDVEHVSSTSHVELRGRVEPTRCEGAPGY